jgi:hypothetical protein
VKLNMPLVTLLSGAVLGIGVLVTSTVWTPGTASAAGSSATASASGASTVTVPLSAPPSSASAPVTTAASAPATAASTSPAPATSQAAATAPAVVTSTAAVTAPASTAPAVATSAAATTNPSYVPAKADYVTQVNGGGAAVAISVHGNNAVAYVCNGHAVAAWYRGKAVGGRLDLTGKSGARLIVTYRKASATGSITADGTHYTFSAPVVHRVSGVHSTPGLYEATAMVHGVKIKAGWIVLPNGGQIGSVEYDPTSAVPPTAQAPLLNLTTDTASYAGVTFVATLISGITGSGF